MNEHIFYEIRNRKELFDFKCLWFTNEFFVSSPSDGQKNAPSFNEPYCNHSKNDSFRLSYWHDTVSTFVNRLKSQHFLHPYLYSLLLLLVFLLKRARVIKLHKRNLTGPKHVRIYFGPGQHSADRSHSFFSQERH